MAGFHEFLAHYEVSSVLLCEQPLVNPIAMYCGTVDCLAVTPNGLVTIDWKTTETLKKYRRTNGSVTSRCFMQVPSTVATSSTVPLIKGCRSRLQRMDGKFRNGQLTCSCLDGLN